MWECIIIYVSTVSLAAGPINLGDKKSAVLSRERVEYFGRSLLTCRRYGGEIILYQAGDIRE